MIALSNASDVFGWIFLGVMLFGGTIAAFFGSVRDILMTWAGRGKSLGRSERKEMERLRIENGDLRDVLREVQVYDQYAVHPLTTELSGKVNEALASRTELTPKRGKSEQGRIPLGVLIPGAGLGAFAWGWFHSASSPNGATVLGVLVIAATVGILWAFGRRWRRTDHAAAVYTKDVEDRLVPDTSGDHIWDA